MAVIGFLGRKAVMACAISSLVAGCSSVEREQTLAAKPTPAPSAEAQANAATQVAAAADPNQQNVTVTKTARLPIPVPAFAEATSAQAAAMASPTMAPIVAFAPAQTAPTISQQPANWTAPATSTILAAGRHETSTTAKVGRLTSPGVAPAVASGQIQPAAAQAIALDETQPTPDMAALQKAIPTPRPVLTTTAKAQQPGTTTLAYAAQPHTVAALSAMEFPPAPGEPMPSTAANAPADLSKLIKRYAGLYGVPESLVHRVVHRESKYDPKAYHKNGYWGLMQIKYSTAKSMGYDGPASGLLDAETNLKYAIKYLRGAWLVADNQNDNAIKLYARGYYYDAKRKDMLHVLEK